MISHDNDGPTVEDVHIRGMIYSLIVFNCAKHLSPVSIPFLFLLKI